MFENGILKIKPKKVIKDNTIFVTGATQKELEQAIGQFIDRYFDKIPKDYNFSVVEKDATHFVIYADERLDNWTFYFLVNYLEYPENIDYEIEIEGFTTGKEDKKLRGKRLLVFIAPNDTDYDNVFVTTSENECYKVDFGGNITPVELIKSYREPLLNVLEISKEDIKVTKVKTTKKSKEATSINEEQDRKIRFKVLSIIFALLIVSSWIIYIITHDERLFQRNTIFCGFVLWIWFFLDYKILRTNSTYLNCLKLSVIVASYGIVLFYLLAEIGHIHLILSSILPLLLLLIQRLTRKLYMKIMKQEPKVEHRGKFSNLIYTLILLSASLGIILYIGQLNK